VTPGFDFADWEMPPAAALREAFPGAAAAAAIARLAAQ
jgi:predicted cupin superfamily sugar epimerase